MARIAYIDHSFHKTTRSTEFLPALLQRHGHAVDHFWDDAWQGGPPVAWKDVAGHDVVIMFQSYCQPEGPSFRLAHPNVVYIPMLDQFGLWLGPMFNLSAFWEVFQGSKVLNFSSALHTLTTGFGIASHWGRYYQPVPSAAGVPASFATPAASASSAQQGLHGFFWLRRELQLPWKTVRRLIEDARFDSFHLHLATDPGTPPAELPSDADIARFNITTSTWFEHKADLHAVMERANVYFAPRPGEGIGQSFLEAMGRGQCVVAPNNGTMNEYIVPGVNGLLYELDDPQPLDFSNVAAMGLQARAGVAAGRAIWERSEDALVRFILTPSADFYVGKYQHPMSTVDAVAAGEHPDLPLEPSGLRELARRHPVFRSTRFIWHPLLNLARRIRGR